LSSLPPGSASLPPTDDRQDPRFQQSLRSLPSAGTASLPLPADEEQETQALPALHSRISLLHSSLLSATSSLPPPADEEQQMQTLPALRSRITVPSSPCHEQQRQQLKSLSSLDSNTTVLPPLKLPPPNEELETPLEEPAESMPMPLEFLPAQVQLQPSQLQPLLFAKPDVKAATHEDIASPGSADATFPRTTMAFTSGRSLGASWPMLATCCVHQEDPCSITSDFFTCAWRSEAPKPRRVDLHKDLNRETRKPDHVAAANQWRWRPSKYCLSLLWAVPTGAILLALFFMLKPDPQARDAVGFGTSVNSSNLNSTDRAAGKPVVKPADRCNVSSDSQLRQHSQAWWCKECGFGCDRTTATTRMTPATTQQMQWNCSSDYATWETSWPETKQRWCCQHLRRGCSSRPLKDQRVSRTSVVLPHRLPPTTTSIPLPPLAAAPNGPCEAVCSLQGHSSSCRGHVDWAVNNWFRGQSRACRRAHTALVRLCPGCTSCTLHALNCSGPRG